MKFLSDKIVTNRKKINTPLFSVLILSIITCGGNFAHAGSGTFQATADASVEEGNPSTNYGGGTGLYSRKSTGNNKYAFVKFDFSAIPAGSLITSATAYFYHYYNYPTDGGLTDAGIYELDDDSWVESAVTWSNKPAEGSLLDSIDCNGVKHLWRGWDVTSYVNSQIGSADSIVSFCLRPETLDGSTICSYVKSREEVTASSQPYVSVTWIAGESNAPAGISSLSALAGLSDGTVRLQWIDPGDDGTGGGNVSSYEVKYATYCIDSETDYNAATNYSPASAWSTGTYGTAHQIKTVSELANGTTYWFAIKAKDEANNQGV